MNFLFKRRYILLIFASTILFSCSKSISNKINITVGIEPQKFFVEKIGGDKVEISVLVKSGMSPENFEPLPSQLLDVSDSKIYYKIGMPFEEILIKNFPQSNPSLKIIDTSKDINFRNSESSISVFENENIHLNHNHGLYDPHIWLSPELVKKQAEAIYNSLNEIDPINKNYYEKKYSTFLNEIDSVKKIITENLGTLKKRVVLVYHPAWGYFCDEFSLKQVPIEFEGKEPGIKDLSKIISFVKGNNIKFILGESQNNSPALISIAKELGVKIIKHDPLSSNYFENLISLSKIIRDNN
ncbi:MAG: hypothetical protein A2068_00410 [Ignavibacteria bacterium GWB2_35_6b]|nr:MAG: hypothetical protein A2068_00410 [Ignavibacteria bacterium GWB2_35_6b]